MKIKKISENFYKIEKSGKMLVDVDIFASKSLLKSMIDDDTLKQASNVAKMPGVLKNVIVLPDGHQGYGANIGCVAGFDLNDGVVSPGATGFDINCGVRILTTNIHFKDFMKKRKEILSDLKKIIPTGVGKKGEILNKKTIKQVLLKGSKWAIDNGFGYKNDLEHTEENGCMEKVDLKDISHKAIERGLSQLGTLGAGNHFIDFQIIEKIYDEKVAKIFGLKKDFVCVMIHCGSRGLGHQIASDYIQEIEKNQKKEKFENRELGYSKINSLLGKKYYSAMKGAVNFAFCNRQIIMHKIRKYLKEKYPDLKSELMYDLAHNISKIEKHKVDNIEKNVLVIRKGATRSFGPGRKEIPKKYSLVGQPIIIPGSMSTPSFILSGTKKSEEISFGSSAHGAGRAHSRMWAQKKLKIKELKKILEKKDIFLEGSLKATIEESEFSYKDIQEIIRVSEEVGLGKKIAKLKPIAVIIG